MMQQYLGIKNRYAGTLLLFRLGDFYELFFGDAEEASSVLGLTLTSRNGMPMCGVPWHAAESYIGRLLKAGKRVAICEQMEDPSKTKGLVRREVTRVITPGTVTDEKLIQSDENNFLMAVWIGAGCTGVAVADISTGEFGVTARSGTAMQLGSFLEDEIIRFAPREVVSLASQAELLPRHLVQGIPAGSVPDHVAHPEYAREALCSQFGTTSLEGFMLRAEDGSLQAAAIALASLRETRLGTVENITAIRRLDAAGTVMLPAITQTNLELVRSFSGGEERTLVSVLDRTSTPMGRRLLRQNILAPMVDPVAINRRLELVAVQTADRVFLDGVVQSLGSIRDLERLASRVALGRANARDLVSIASSLEGVHALRKRLLEKPAFFEICQGIDSFEPLVALLRSALTDEPALSLDEGGMIRTGYSGELDELRALQSGGEEALAAMQQRERERTGIGSLKIRYNRVIGYYIEVSKSNLANVPPEYQRKQSMAGGERFVTDELREYEGRILGAQERVIELERSLFHDLAAKTAEWLGRIGVAAGRIAEVDVLASFARNALDYGYVRPVVDESDRLAIIDGRHPVIERVIPEPFVPNTTELDLAEHRIKIVTGPNMAGKSTYLRQTALIVLMAQIGSWVPAASAHIGVVDRIFTRVGASDNLARGQSTFLVEMLETAAILHNATSRSLIIMDEIGRGTSTYDGLSLARSVAEYLLEHPEVGGRTLFATHYHEMTVLGEREGAGNLNVQVREWNDEVIFLRKVIPGAADKSYGIHVARLAGLPHPVIRRARQILHELEDREGARPVSLSGEGQAAVREASPQLSLFGAREEAVIERIRAVNPDHITPLDALKLLVELREGLGG